MKKIVLSSAILAAFISANAQEALSTPTVGYKPAAGNVVVELGLYGGLNGTYTDLNRPGNSLYPNMVKLRYFLADDLAFRASFNFSAYSTTNKAYELDASFKQTSTVGTQKIRNSFYGVNLGIEKHFTGTERLSTYIGGDLSLGLAGASLKEDKYNAGDYDKDYARTIKGSNGQAGADERNGSFGWGLRAVTGADYYFVKKVYLGAELGWGFFSAKNRGVKTEVTTLDPVTNKTVTETTETKSDGGAFSLTPQVVAQVRIGYIF